jgi:hypothetical protein
MVNNARIKDEKAHINIKKCLKNKMFVFSVVEEEK